MPATTPLPDEIDALRAMVTALQAQNLSIERALNIERAKVSALDQHIATIEQQPPTRYVVLTVYLLPCCIPHCPAFSNCCY